MATFVVSHGAWAAGWAWKKMRPLMAARGHTLFTPTHTGLGERAHLAHADVDLETHIADILAVLFYEDLKDVILIGHSYGGMVATGVADRARDRITALVYLDAYAPQDGECLFDLAPGRRETMGKAAAESGDGWKMPVSQLPADMSDEDKAWAAERRMPQPIRTFDQPLRFRNGALTLPRHYIYCARHAPDDRFRPFYERAKTEGWGAYEIDSSHQPHVTVPEALMDLLDGIAAKAA
jgi:pimeloyl-ACP methyl ester carboxylesterase